MTSPGKLSLFVTLGIAAIDMLTCAFISTILLFVMFLTPQSSAGGAASASQNVLIVHWAFQEADGAIIGLELGPKGNTSLFWSDGDMDDMDRKCSQLSKSTKGGACALIESEPTSYADYGMAPQDGILMIAEPVAGEWDIVVIYGDTPQQANADASGSVRATLSIVGSEAAVVEMDLVSGQEKSVKQAGLDNLSTLEKIMHFE